MTSTLRRTSAAALALGLLFGAVACSSDSGGASEKSTTTTSGTDGTDGDGGTASDSTNECDAPREAGAGEASSSLSVSFGSESEVTPETTLTVSADGTSISPSTLTVDVGEAIGIRVADGGKVYGATIGCSGPQTVMDTFTSGYVIKEPGTYPVALDGNKVGTITAK